MMKGRDEHQIRRLLDAAHRGMTQAFGTPERDRYQIVHQHEPHEMVIEDTGLGIERSRDIVVISIVSRERPQAQKLALYEALADELEAVGVPCNDLVVSLTTNNLADWSFGLGRAQFITGELETRPALTADNAS
jgi:hypothetical protein